MSPVRTIDIDGLGFDRGAHILIKKDLAELPAGGRLEVRGRAEDLSLHVGVWCRSHGHVFEVSARKDTGNGTGTSPHVGVVIRGVATDSRWRDAEQAGWTVNSASAAVVENPKASWGLAARGATVEAGAPEFHFPLSSKVEVWADEAARIYAHAVASQWDPNTAIDWHVPMTHSRDVEQAVAQIMTYLVENENAALLVPARFLGQIHPHFREILQVLAVQVADEARHIEVFTRRAILHGESLGVSTSGGQISLKTLFEESDFATASFLLSVLGEGTFVNLLQFLHEHAPDPVTRQIVRLVGQDEARHVAFGMAHLRVHIALDPGIRYRLASAIQRRHGVLAGTGGLNEEVHDALILLAAGKWDPDAIGRGWDSVHALEAEMTAGRQRRLIQLGFAKDEAEELAALHTRNFM